MAITIPRAPRDVPESQIIGSIASPLEAVRPGQALGELGQQVAKIGELFAGNTKLEDEID